ncbi:MAG: hypothetical protein A2087_11905 [Spirochaetes bacterium GWD1_61_31]|nr:MAG: hypothetical protein A2Y37_07025 [Spirochaetes bacterium GWB1_60_80]OHD30824.1 MAG: hypothetical protein A2004_04550 [Spirochaetes bacterium GWC1_61_12]OHD37375.1 MAG: hypothetical protein A2087_11905 [Spirochaetes bacterium GWD1_61_31]OHD46324.1 MAG: hypothetical protein A2Y35_07300 [Spirochaetes bacterium GWE1_60_18]OHD60931.1 MAG: hypothetical protein A2Y32_12045 [Spirochaetes bacterium GWF1_60_12]
MTGLLVGLAMMVMQDHLSSDLSLADEQPVDPSAGELALGELPAAPQPVPEPATIDFLIVGDIMLARSIGQQIRRLGVMQPFAAIQPLVQAADLSLANLECPVSDLGAPAFSFKPAEITFRAEPRTLEGLKAAGFDAVSLANNHTTDYGREAMVDTIRRLSDHGIATCGAGANAAAARTPAILESQGIRIAVLAYGEHAGASFEAWGDSAGIAILRPAAVRADIARAKATGVDYVFVSLHWGAEYIHYPPDRLRSLAHSLVEAGADAVIGHHAHVLQGIEVYRDRPIFYGMGNFIFDQPPEPTRRSMAVVLRLAKAQPLRLEVVPLMIARPNYHPYPVSGDAAASLLVDIETYSQPFGTLFQRQGDRLIFQFRQRAHDWLRARDVLRKLAR